MIQHRVDCFLLGLCAILFVLLYVTSDRLCRAPQILRGRHTQSKRARQAYARASSRSGLSDFYRRDCRTAGRFAVVGYDAARSMGRTAGQSYRQRHLQWLLTSATRAPLRIFASRESSSDFALEGELTAIVPGYRLPHAADRLQLDVVTRQLFAAGLQADRRDDRYPPSPRGNAARNRGDDWRRASWSVTHRNADSATWRFSTWTRLCVVDTLRIF